MTIDHLGIPVPLSEHKKVVDFYLAVLKPLGYTKVMAFGPNEEVIGIGTKDKPDYWITATPDASPKLNLHIAFATSDRAVVDAFHAAAMEAGAKDNGAPGLRPNYHENYYGAFVIDSLGNNLEVVCRSAAE